MKKFGAVVAMLVMVLWLFCGCAKVDYKIDIQNDDKVHLEASLLMDSDLYSVFSQTKLEIYRQQLKSSGFTVSYHSAENQEGLLATIDLNSVEALNQSPTNILPIQSMSYGHKELLFFQRHSIYLAMDMSGFVSSLKLISDESSSTAESSEPAQEQDENTDGEEDTASSELTSSEADAKAKETAVQDKLKALSPNDLAMTVTITLPQKVNAEGATLSNTGNTATWKIDVNGPNTIRLESTQVKWIPLVLTLFLTSVLAILSLVMFFQYRKGRNTVCKSCRSKNYYKRATCRRCGAKLPLRPRKVVHNQRLLSLITAIFAGVLLLFILIGAVYTGFGKVATQEIKSGEVKLTDLINQISAANQVVDPTAPMSVTASEPVSSPESSMAESSAGESGQESSDEDESSTTSKEEGMTQEKKIEILVAVSKQQEEALAKYSTDDYWDARTYLGDAFETAQVMQGLYQSDADLVDQMYDTYVQAGIIDQNGNILSLLMGYKPSAQAEPISENQAIKNVKNYLESKSYTVPENSEISDSDDTTYTVHFFNGTESNLSDESWYQVHKFTGEILSDY